MTQSFAVPLPLPQLNDVLRDAKRHWSRYSTPKRQHTHHVAWLAKVAKLRPVDGPVAMICIWHPRDRRVDPDNVAHGLKYIADGLVVAGVLPGDGYQVIREIRHLFAAPDRDNARVEVAIEEVAA